MARGNRRETIFHDDDDCRFFLATLSEACAMTGWRVHAWVLMGNHYHLFIETPEANLVAGMKRFDLPDTVAGRRRLVERLDRRAVEEEIKKCGMPCVPEKVDARCSHLRRGWYWGSQEFAGKLHKLAEKLMKARRRSSRAYRETPQLAAHSEEQAGR